MTNGTSVLYNRFHRIVSLLERPSVECGVQAGLADIKGWGQYMGAQWCGEGTDIERALEHSNQAVRYLISGKDDCVRKACKVWPSLASLAHPDPCHTHPAPPPPTFATLKAWQNCGDCP